MAKNTESGKKRGFLSNLLHPGQAKSSGEPTQKEATIIPASPKATKPKAEVTAKAPAKAASKPAEKAAVKTPAKTVKPAAKTAGKAGA